MKKKKWDVKTLLSGALALLGFAGCSDNNEDYLCLYGSPSVDFKVFGTVTDEHGKPLEGIQVVVDSPGAYSYYNNKEGSSSPSIITYPDTLYTDKDGKFASHKVKAPSSQKLTVEVQDIDGEANGGDFQTKHLTRDDFNEKQIKKGEGFYNGEYEYSKNIQLEPKSE